MRMVYIYNAIAMLNSIQIHNSNRKSPFPFDNTHTVFCCWFFFFLYSTDDSMSICSKNSIEILKLIIMRIKGVYCVHNTYTQTTCNFVNKIIWKIFRSCGVL